MADKFLMPKLGLTMESGTIVSWLVDDGAAVEAGQTVLIIETDKLETEIESTGAGALHQIAQVGQEYECGDTIGWLLEPGEAVPETVAVAAAPASAAAAPSTASPPSATNGAGAGGRLLASPNAKRLAAERGIDLRAIAGTGPGGRITSEDLPATAPAPVAQAVARPAAAVSTGPSRGVATAAARSLADMLGIDIADVPSTGPDPRVGRDDVALYVRTLLAGATAVPGGPPAAAESAAPLLQEPSEVIPMAGMRGRIADRMADSLHSMAQLTLTMDVVMDGVIADRERRKVNGDASVPSYTDYVIAAAAGALGDHPVVNSQINDDGLALLPQINVGMAVAIDGGLVVPVVQNTPALSLEDLAAETTRLATAARDGSLKLPDLEGGTFSVTALGMFGVDAFTPIINAPNTAILGVGRLRDEVVWDDSGAPTRSKQLTLSLTWDHRAFDGAPAAEFAQTIANRLAAHS